jgi:hypothetical protein
MKLSQLKEAVYDHEHYSLLQKAAVQLGYQRMQLHDSDHIGGEGHEPGGKWHYDGAPDVETAIQIMRLPLEQKATAWNALQRLSSLRLLDIDDTEAPRKALDGPLSRLRGVAELAKAYQEVGAQQDWVRTSAKNVQTVLMLLNGIKMWATKKVEPNTDESFKSSIARAVLRKLKIPLEDE